jgi:transposase-like protein
MSQAKGARSRGGRRGRGEEYYRQLVGELEASGSTLRAFALERGLSPWTLYDWRSRLKRTGGGAERREEAQPTSFVEVDVARASEPTDKVELVLGDGLVVRLPHETGPERLIEIVRALRSC